jgi:pimeloyl-ACP methyl ester carboxylesterase
VHAWSAFGAQPALLDCRRSPCCTTCAYGLGFDRRTEACTPPFLAVWGKNDPFFLPPGAEAFKRDIPGAEVRFFDTGHFALETHCNEIAAAMRDFLSRSK